MRKFLIIALFSVLLLGCIDADSAFDTDVDANTSIDADADVDVQAEIQAEIQAQVESFLNANLENLIEAKVDTKVQGVGVDIKNKVADELNADIKSELDTKIKALISANTQNVGMFSGGGIYILIAFVSFMAFLFAAIVYLTKQISKWKKIWNLVSHTIEKYEGFDQYTDMIKELKSHISTSLEITELKETVDKNLEKRGLRNRNRG